MSIKKEMHKVLEALYSTKNKGNTSMLLTASKSNHALIVIERHDRSNALSNSVSLNDVVHGKLDGYDGALLLDNGLVIYLLREALVEMGEMEKQLHERDETIKEINSILQRFHNYIKKEEPLKEWNIFNNAFIRNFFSFSKNKR